MRTLLIAAALASVATVAQAGPSPAVPRQLDDAQVAGYRAVFAAIRAQKWLDAKLTLATMPTGPLHALARAELLTAKGSPKADPAELAAALAEGPELPQAEQIARMAENRGATGLAALPGVQRLVWTDGAPVRRTRAKSTAGNDAAAIDLAARMQPLIKDDRGEEAEALLDAKASSLSADCLTEWRQRVAFMYYVAGNDPAARRMASLAATGDGDWALHARWTVGLSAWRQQDYAAANAAFADVATRSSDTELRAAALYWTARTDMAAGHPERIEARLKNAAQLDETFYGLLARQTLGIRDPKSATDGPGAAAWQQLAQRPNIRVAAALSEIGEDELADAVIRRQARIGNPAEFAALSNFAGDLGLPGTQLWLTNNVPQGGRPAVAARYPAPTWVPDGGWRVDKSLVFAHTLQESRFRTGVVSPAGAYGLMQIMPASATDFTRATGIMLDKASLTRPSVNMAVGQDKLQRLRDTTATGGLLPKVIAAYNAGPVPVGAWNAESRDGGDPLLYIESIPFWETRGYVATVLRNYWMYERNGGKASPSRAALAQGLWPKFPGMAGAPAVRLQTAIAPARLRPLPPPPLTVDPAVLAAPTVTASVASSSVILGSN